MGRRDDGTFGIFFFFFTDMKEHLCRRAQRSEG